MRNIFFTKDSDLPILLGAMIDGELNENLKVYEYDMVLDYTKHIN